MVVDEIKLQEFITRAVVDLGGAVNAVLMSIGDELGLYKALTKGPQLPVELARNTGTHERYIREWLNSQAAGAMSHTSRVLENTGSMPSRNCVWPIQTGPWMCPAPAW